MQSEAEYNFLHKQVAAVPPLDKSARIDGLFTSAASAEAILVEPRTSEESSLSGTIIEEPNERDILCGQDKTFNLRPGNQQFKDVIYAYSGAYHQESCTRKEKMRLTQEIVEKMQTLYNARFLRPAPKGRGYEVVSKKVAREKVSHALRWTILGEERKQRAKQKRRVRSRSTCGGGGDHQSATTAGEHSSSCSPTSVITKPGLLSSARRKYLNKDTIAMINQPPLLLCDELEELQEISRSLLRDSNNTHLNRAQSDSTLYMSPVEERTHLKVIKPPRVYQSAPPSPVPSSDAINEFSIFPEVENNASHNIAPVRGSCSTFDQQGGGVVSSSYLERLLKGPLLDDDSFIFDG